MAGLGDTGRIMSALSDSYLPSMGLDDNHHHHPHPHHPHQPHQPHQMLNPVGMDQMLSPEETLLPPALSAQDRHPSAPQLASMLSSSASVDNGGKVPGDVMMGEEVNVDLNNNNYSVEKQALSKDSLLRINPVDRHCPK